MKNLGLVSVFGLLISVGIAHAAPTDPVTQSMINQPNGVAGLDANGAATSPYMPQNAWLGEWQTVAPTTDLFTRPYETSIFGGLHKYTDGNYEPQSLLLQVDPYAGYAKGCGFGITMLGSVYSSQFPVSQGDPRLGAPSVAGVGYDTVANCVHLGNQPARLILTATGYTATSVNLATALTADQAAQIHPFMYIVTNSPNPALTPTPVAGQTPPKNLYAGYVSAQPAAGATYIGVYAWDVPGYGTGINGQVPQTATLDTAYSAYPSPTVFLGGGAASSAFAQNWFYSIDANDLTPSASNRSLIHQFTPLEIDMKIVNGTPPNNSVFWQGIGLNAGNFPDALTTDSRQLFLGGVINHHLIINGGCGNWDYEGNSDGGADYMPTPCGINSTSSSQVSQEWGQHISGANTVRTVLWNQLGNPTATTGWQQDVVHFGPTVDGAPSQTGAPGGSLQGDIEWNHAGVYGGISLCGYGVNCNFVVNGNGTPFSYPTGLPSGANGFVIGSQPAGYAAVFGAYAPSGSLTNLVDIEQGNVSEFLVDASGNGTFKGAITGASGKFSGSIQTTQLLGVSASGANLAQLYPTSAGDWQIGTSVSNGGSIRNVNGFYGQFATLSGNLGAATVTTTGNITSSAALIAPTAVVKSGDGSGQVTISASDRSTLSLANDAGSGVTIAAGAARTSQFLLASASLSTSGVTGGQGFAEVWNTVRLSRGSAEFINVNPNAIGGFDFYDTLTGGSPSTSDLILTMSKGQGAIFGTNLQAPEVITTSVFHEPLTTPASSSAACAAGDFTDDANYHYVCVATNTWKRVALSSF